jgi:hypothetical protein
MFSMGFRIALFPGRLFGFGLLVLRISVASSMVATVAPSVPAIIVLQILAFLGASALCAGFQTRAVAVLCVLSSVPGLFQTEALAASIGQALSAAALTMTGPGAYSVDAWVFGHRTITVPERSNTKE